MKLKEWADRTGVKYLTAYRWFKAGTLPVKAYQTDSGTIIVDDPDFSEQQMNTQDGDVMKLFLKKTVEFSKNNASVEDFAAYVLSNFSLKANSVSESPKYSKNKPKPEEIQKHFQQFLKPKGEKPKPSMLIAPPEVVEEIAEKEGWSPLPEHKSQGEIDVAKMGIDTVTMTDMSGLNALISPYNEAAEGMVSRSVDLTPQLNYTGSDNHAFSNNLSGSLSVNSIQSTIADLSDLANTYFANTSVGAFKPTQKELETSSKLLESPRARRGRKSHKKDKL